MAKTRGHLTPDCLVTLDCEGWRAARAGGEDQALRLWTARLTDRRPTRWGRSEQLAGRGRTAHELAVTLDEWMKGRRVVAMYAHNLQYDLVSSQLVDWLCHRGWQVAACSSDPEYPWVKIERQDKTIIVGDTLMIWPTAAEKIGSAIGKPKLRMPRQGAPDAEWFTYCQQDTDIIHEALLEALAYWDAKRLGDWRLTGASTGWAAMRNATHHGEMITAPDNGIMVKDREAVYGGRRYSWRHGHLPPGRYSELDFTAAHATVAANYPLPRCRGSEFDGLDIDDDRICSERIGVIAECEIDTDAPRWPVKINGHVWYPVGRFRTVLAGPDIAEARRLGCLRSIGRGRFHMLGTGLQPFFRRVLAESDPMESGNSAIIQMIWKHFGRSVIGKTAQHGYREILTLEPSPYAWHYEEYLPDAQGRAIRVIHYGGQIHHYVEDADSVSAYPAVLAWVEAYERIALARAADILGPRVCVTCNTDGLWIDVGALESGTLDNLGFRLADVDRRVRVALAVDIVNKQLGALQLREKSTYSQLTVYGPQNYDAGPYTRQSGKPGKGTRRDDGTWIVDRFHGLAESMAKGDMGVVRLDTIEWNPPACAIPAWVLADGSTRPVEAWIDASGQSQLVPWIATRWSAAGELLGGVQTEPLADLWTTASAPPPAERGQLDGQAADAAPAAIKRPPAPAFRPSLATLRAHRTAASDALKRHRRVCLDCSRRAGELAGYCADGYELATAEHNAKRQIDAELAARSAENQGVM